MKVKLIAILILTTQNLSVRETFSIKDIEIHFLNEKVAQMQEKVAYLQKYKDTLEQVKQVSEYFWKLGQFESSNKYDTINVLGYLGKYQFGIQTLRTLGFNCTPEEFLASPLLQEQAIIVLNIYNNKLLQKYLDYDTIRYDYLAGAHLGGARNVIRYVKEKHNPEDYFGTSVADYIKEFKD